MIELKTLRKSTHMTQEEFANILKVPVSTYSKWEQGVNNPTESQIFLICHYLYNEGYIKTYLNDSNLTLTEMGLLMTWLRYDSYHRFSANTKGQICQWFREYVSKDEADEIYKKLHKHYIISRKIPVRTTNKPQSMSPEECEQATFRILDSAGIEILPYDGGLIRSNVFEADAYFFFSRLSDMLGLENNKIRNMLLSDCHDNFFIQDDLSIQAQAVMNCLYYKYVVKFPLCFGVEDLINNYGETFYTYMDELIEHGYAKKLNGGYYEFNTDNPGYKYGSRFYIHAKLLGQKYLEA